MKRNLILGIMCLLSFNVSAQFSFGDASLTGKKWTKGDFAFGKEAVWVFRYAASVRPGESQSIESFC